MEFNQNTPEVLAFENEASGDLHEILSTRLMTTVDFFPSFASSFPPFKAFYFEIFVHACLSLRVVDPDATLKKKNGSRFGLDKSESGLIST